MRQAGSVVEWQSGRMAECRVQSTEYSKVKCSVVFASVRLPPPPRVALVVVQLLAGAIGRQPPVS